MGLDVWFLVGPFVFTSILHVCQQRRFWQYCADWVGGVLGGGGGAGGDIIISTLFVSLSHTLVWVSTIVNTEWDLLLLSFIPVAAVALFLFPRVIQPYHMKTNTVNLSLGSSQNMCLFFAVCHLKIPLLRAASHMPYMEKNWQDGLCMWVICLNIAGILATWAFASNSPIVGPGEFSYFSRKCIKFTLWSS